MKKILKRSATTYGGRNGMIKDTDSGIELTLDKPVEMGGVASKGTNPEELFSIGYSSCFASSIEYLLQLDHVAYDDIKVQVDTLLMAEEEKGFKFSIVIHAHIGGVGQDVEKTYIDKAYGFCPYSKAISGNVEVKINI